LYFNVLYKNLYLQIFDKKYLATKK